MAKKWPFFDEKKLSSHNKKNYYAGSFEIYSGGRERD